MKIRKSGLKKLDDFFKEQILDKFDCQNNKSLKMTLKDHVLKNFSLKMMENEMSAILSKLNIKK